MSDGKKYSDYVTTVQDYAESNKITFVTTRKITSSSSLEVTNRLLRTTKNGDKEIFKKRNVLISLGAVFKGSQSKKSQDHRR